MADGTDYRGLERMRHLRPLVISTLRGERTSYAARHDGACARELALASYNIHKAVGTDGRFDPRRTVQVIRELDADVVALQEADRRFGERIGLLDLDALKAATGLRPVPLNPASRAHGWHGNVILFREGEVTGVRELTLPGVEPRGALIVDLELEHGPLRVIGAHLGLLRRSRSLQVDTLLAEAQPDDGRPTVLMGDFNEWRLGSRSSLQGLQPLFGPLQAALPSFPSRKPLWALDRIVAYPASMVATVDVHDSPLARVASDHLPLKARIRIGATADASAR